MTTVPCSSSALIAWIPKILLRDRGRHDAPEAVAVRLERPALLAREAVGLRLVVDRADRLRRVVEGGSLRSTSIIVSRVASALLERQQVAELLLDQVADHALGLGAEQVERVHLDGRVGRALQGEQPDLRPVPVRDHELVLERHRREGLAGGPGVRALVLRGQRLPAPQQRVPAEGDDDAHRQLPERRDHDGLDRVQPVLRLVEDERRRRLEDLLGHLEAVHPELLEDLLADLGVGLWNAGRQCMNFDVGVAGRAIVSAFTGMA